MEFCDFLLKVVVVHHQSINLPFQRVFEWLFSSFASLFLNGQIRSAQVFEKSYFFFPIFGPDFPL